MERSLFNGESLATFTVISNEDNVINDKWKTLNLETSMSINGEEYKKKVLS